MGRDTGKRRRLHFQQQCAGFCQIERKLDDVEATRSQIVKPVAEAQELMARGLPVSMIGEAQNMAGVTPEGAADKIDDELRQAAA
jgi:hypothetical protein